MPKLPILNGGSPTREMIDVFAGYNHNLKIRDGEFFFTKDLTTQFYPLLANRARRGVLDRQFTRPQAIIAKDAPYWVENGTLYANGYATGLTGLQTVKETQLVSMGAYICVFPDKKYINTQNLTEYGSMEATYSSTGTVTFTLCRADGTDYESIQVGDVEPASTSVEVWISTAGGNAVAMSYSVSYGGWVELGTVYTKLTFASQGQIPTLFKEGDGVTISGADFEDANGEKILYAVGGSGTTGAEVSDFVVVVGLLEAAITQTSGSVKIERKVPTMDFVCEAGNRLWGCFYGNDGTQNLNEIYCCALGDFKNWRQYRGLSTDSWTASVGSDGQWTGAVNYLGSPVFFKENRIHQVGISSVGAHTLQETVCRGVQKGSHKSLVVVNETLFYKSRSDVCAWQGGFPQGVSEALGEEQYYAAVGGAFGGRYFLSMKDAGDNWHLFVYDISKGLWMREDSLHVLQFAAVEDEIYAFDADAITPEPSAEETDEEEEEEDPEPEPTPYYRLLALNGTQGVLEESPEWIAESGIQHYEYPDKKYVSRYDIRLRMDAGATMKMYIEYDSKSPWVFTGDVSAGSVLTDNTGSCLVPVRPRRCDHLRLRFVGKGDVRVLSIARVIQKGSDV